MKLRPLVFWPHLVVGLLSGLVVLVMSVTGVLLTYERQMIAWADARMHPVVPPTPGATPAPVDRLLSADREGKAQSIILRADPAATATLSFGRGRPALHVDPYTAEPLGHGSERMRAFMSSMRSWHRWLALEGASRAVGRAVTGAFNVAFLFLILSGLFLWFPRRLTWRSIRAVLLFRPSARGKLRDWNWHHALGFWSAIPLAIVVASATVISYPSVSRFVTSLGGTSPQAQAAAVSANAGDTAVLASAAVEAIAAPPTLTDLLARAKQQVPGWRTISLKVPAEGDATAAFTIDAGTGGQPQHRGTLTLDRATGEVVSWEPFASLDRGRQIRSVLRFAHTGEVGGLLGQTIAGLVSAAAVILVYTGTALSFRRFFGRRRTTTEAASGA